MPGVTEILSVGGGVKQYQVKIDPRSLRQYGVSIIEVRDALMANNRNVGGGFIVRGSEEYLIRGIGLAETLGDLENVIVASRAGTPIYVKNLGSVALGPEVRRGAATMNGRGEVVIGVVLPKKENEKVRVPGDGRVSGAVPDIRELDGMRMASETGCGFELHTL